MSSNTRQKIIKSARECFLSCGFRASNMSLISKFAGFSRVTLHKHFKNKERVFHAVCVDYRTQCQEQCQVISDQDLPCWEMIQQVTDVWTNTAFDDIQDSLVLKELFFEAQQVAADIFTQATVDLAKMLEGILDNGIKKSEINLQACQLSSAQLSIIILATLSGIRANQPKPQILTISHQAINLYRLATAINK